MVSQKYTSQDMLYVLLFLIVASHCTILHKNITKILKTLVKDENNDANNIEDGEIMVSFGITFLCTNIPLIDPLNIINNYFNDDKFMRKMTTP